MTPEGRVKAAVKRLLKEYGIWYYCPMQNGMGVVGVPDFICCWNGQFIAIETKAPGKRDNVTQNQKRRIEEIRNAGGVAVVIDDVEVLRALLDTMRYKPKTELGKRLKEIRCAHIIKGGELKKGDECNE